MSNIRKRSDVSSVLLTTQEEFDAMHAVMGKARANAKNVTVDHTALAHLLIDHSKLVAKLEEML